MIFLLVSPFPYKKKVSHSVQITEVCRTTKKHATSSKKLTNSDKLNLKTRIDFFLIILSPTLNRMLFNALPLIVHMDYSGFQLPPYAEYVYEDSDYPIGAYTWA